MTKPSNRRRGAAFAAILLAGTALSGAAGWLVLPAFAEAERPQATAPATAAAVTPPALALPGFADLVARVRPAVVTITTTTGEAEADRVASPFPQGSAQDRMFRRYFGEQAPARRAQALGSGFVIDAGGHIVTNNHVVNGASRVMVTLDDGRELQARIVGRDPRTDLALLKVEAGAPLAFLNLGDSDQARPGDWVVAVGNPFGLGGSVTAGIVSARGRDIHSGPYDDFLQIDAPINRGNSGGPLFGLDGRVIGVNTAIFSPSGGSIGIGFAIPSNLVRSVVAQLQENGRVERGFLGASLQPVDAAMARAMGLPQATGALVAEVERDGPAARAGLRAGDVVTAIGDTAVRGPRELARAVAELRGGTDTTLSVRRDGREQRLTVELATLQDRQTTEAAARDGKGGQQAERGRLGFALASVEEAQQAGVAVPRGTEGAVVAEVRPDGPAAEAGLRPSDIITAVGSQTVRSPEQAAAAIREALRSNNGAVALRLLRDGRQAFVAVQTPAETPRGG